MITRTLIGYWRVCVDDRLMDGVRYYRGREGYAPSHSLYYSRNTGLPTQ